MKNVTPRTHENDCVFNRVTLRKKKIAKPSSRYGYDWPGKGAFSEMSRFRRARKCQKRKYFLPGQRRGRPWSLFPPNVGFRENARFATWPPPAAHRRIKPHPGGRRRGSGDARGHMAISLIGIERAAHFRTFFRRPSASRAIGSTGKSVFPKCLFLSLYVGAHTTRRTRFF